MAELTWPVGLYQKHISLGRCTTSDTRLKQSSDLERLRKITLKYYMLFLGKLTGKRRGGSGILVPPVIACFKVFKGTFSPTQSQPTPLPWTSAGWLAGWLDAQLLYIDDSSCTPQVLSRCTSWLV